MLSLEEDEKLVQYLFNMQEHAHPLLISNVNMKIAELTKDMLTSFKNDILEVGWLQWFWHRHLKLSLRSPQCLKKDRVRGLNPKIVGTLYHNLEFVYMTHNYLTHYIWNVDESRA